MPLFRKKKPMPQTPVAKDTAPLMKYNGMKVVVSSDEEKPDDMFAGILLPDNQGGVLMRQLSNTMYLDSISLQEEKVRLRGFSPADHTTVHIKALISKKYADLWNIMDYEFTAKGNERKHVRYNFTETGKLNGSACQLVNLSEGGACVRTGAFIPRGGWVSFSAMNLPASVKAPIDATIRNIRPLQTGGYEYGLQFTGIDEAVKAELLAALAQKAS